MTYVGIQLPIYTFVLALWTRTTVLNISKLATCILSHNGTTCIKMFFFFFFFLWNRPMCIMKDIVAVKLLLDKNLNFM